MTGNGKKLRLLIFATLAIAVLVAGAYPLLLHATEGPIVTNCGCPYIWSIDKVADQNEVTLSLGQQLQVNYSVTVSARPPDICSPNTDECVSVYDTNKDPSLLGTACVGEAPKTFTYSIFIGPYCECGNYTVCNTASFVTCDTCTTGCDSWSIIVHVPCDDGCTLTPGYWKTHSKYGPAPYDDTWAMVDPDGEDNAFFDTGQSWYEALWTAPKGGNAYYILAHAYIAGVLNELNGASVPAEVESAMDDAEVLLDEYDGNPESMDGLKGKDAREIRQAFIDTAKLLDDYNNGLIGPGHCTE